MGIDLHAHTTASDGSLEPAQLVAKAHQCRLKAIGITDHDTIAGWPQALKAGEEIGIEVVPGVELSVAYEGGRFHLLAYYVAADSELTQVLAKIQQARANRNGEILANLQRLGMPLEAAEVRALAGADGQIGRPHFARAMIERGYVKSTQQAFDLYLGDDRPAYASKAVLSPQRAIELIHQAGGVAIWAHPPRAKKYGPDELETRLRDWVEWGLDGLEVFYAQYTPDEAAWAQRMAQRYHLLGTGGSDYHGVSKPDVQLGVTNTGGPVPEDVLNALKVLAAQRRQSAGVGEGTTR